MHPKQGYGSVMSGNLASADMYGSGLRSPDRYICTSQGFVFFWLISTFEFTFSGVWLFLDIMRAYICMPNMGSQMY